MCGGFAQAASQNSTVSENAFLLRAYQDKAAIMWQSDIGGAQKLKYASKNFPEQTIVSTPEQITYEINKHVFIHKVWLENLLPGQIYNYSIGEAAIKTYSFRAMPADTNEVTFVVYGDSRTGAENHKKIVSQIIRTNPDFVIHTGDLVSNGNRYEQYGPQFFGPLQSLCKSVAVYIAKGNHEGKNGTFEKLFIPPGEKNDFAIKFGPVYYYLADNYSEDLTDKELLNFIASNLRSAHAEWKFVSFHEPAINIGGHNSKWCWPDALPTFADAGADFVIAGHSHMYERFRPIAPRQNSAGSVVTYITTGGGGAPVAKTKRTSLHAATDSVLHFCLFKIKGSRLTMEVIDSDGRIIDRLEITKNGGKLNEEYLRTSAPMGEVLVE